MYRLIQFIKRCFPALLFVVLEVLAISYYVNSSSYTRAKTMAAVGEVTGKVYGAITWAGDWLSLRKDNNRLAESLAAAHNEIAALRETAATNGAAANGVADNGTAIRESAPREFADSHIPTYGTAMTGGSPVSLHETAIPAAPENPYLFSAAKVINNTITRKENFFVIDKGMKEGVERNMSVVTPEGYVAGYVEDVSSNFAVCMSVLNREFRIGGRVKSKDYVGSVYWDGTDTRRVTLSDIPKYAPLAVGDTIVSAYSSRFPPGLTIGTIERLGDSPDGTYFQARVRLAADMAGLSDVLLIKYNESQELQQLEEQYLHSGVQER